MQPTRMTESAQRSALLTLYAVCASLITIVQRYLSFHFDSFTQNAYRTTAGALGLLLIVALFRRRQLRQLIGRPGLAGRVLVLAILTTLTNSLFVEGVTRTSATLSGLLSLLILPLTVGLAVLIFPDEREATRSPRLRAGLLLALLGTVGLTLGSSSTGASEALGVLFLVLAAVVGAVFSLLTKRLLVTADPLCMGALNTSLVSVFMVAEALLWGDLSAVGRVAPIVNATLLFSGLYGLFIGVGLQFVNIGRFGLVVTRVAELATPAFTAVFAYLLFHEAMAPLQVAFSALLLAGCFLVLTGPSFAKPVPARIEPMS
ncbi:MAG: DMT family transporter [Anaerolineae bacterium]